MGQQARLLLSRRGLRTISLRALAVFAVVSGLIQLYSAIFVPEKSLPHPLGMLIATVLGSFLAAVLQSWPRGQVARTFRYPEMTITVRKGDILDEHGQIVVGFADTFDTDITDDEIISSKSLQGQLLSRRFGGQSSLLDHAISDALGGLTPSSVTSDTKKGKHQRYPIGTVAVMTDPDGRRIFGLAYTRISDELVAKATIHDLWQALNSLWDAVYRVGQHEPVTMPLIGTKLARIQCVDRESLLRIVLLSFVARSREEKISSQFTVVVHPDEWRKMNWLEVEAFLRSLE